MAAFGVQQIQNGGRCHGNQGAKNFKFTPNFTMTYPSFECTGFYSRVINDLTSNWHIKKQVPYFGKMDHAKQSLDKESLGTAR
jgi:hypothetical protein